MSLLAIAVLLLHVRNAAGQSSCEQKLLRKSLEEYPYARCSDHSNALYYISNSTVSDRWMIFLEGGGVCPTLQACCARYLRDSPLMSNNPSVYNETLCGATVFDAADVRNPFRNYRHVLLPYCTQDIYIGNNTDALESPFRANDVQSNCSTNPGFAFAGSHVYRAMFAHLNQSLQAATEIVLAGTSAGALGNLNHARWVQEQFPRANITLLLDSPWIIDYKDIGRTDLFTNFARENSNFESNMACQVSYNGLPCCVSPECMLRNTEVGLPANIPVLIITSTFDLFMLQIAIEQGQAQMFIRSAFVDLIADYGGAVNQTLNAARARNGVSIIQTKCSQHTYLVSSSLWESQAFNARANGEISLLENQIGFSHHINKSVWTIYRHEPSGVDLVTLIQSWLSNVTAGQVLRSADECSGFLCNTRCPDVLLLGTSSSTFGEGFAVFVVILAVLISVGAFLLKIALKVHLWSIKRSMKQFLSDTEKTFSDCLPESTNVSVACYDLAYSITIPGVAKPLEDEEEMMPADQPDNGYGENGGLNGVPQKRRSSDSYMRSNSAPASTSSDQHPPPRKPIRFRSLRQRSDATEIKTPEIKVSLSL